MKIYSFCEYHRDWIRVEIEVSLIPGLPQIHLLGLPDQVIKESMIKIKSALRFQGYTLPKAKQIIVNIRGGDFKKKSSGVELAIVIGILHATGQLWAENINRGFTKASEIYAFGEISLTGEVFPLDDFLVDEKYELSSLITGLTDEKFSLKNHCLIKELKELSELSFESLNHLNSPVGSKNSEPVAIGIQSQTFLQLDKESNNPANYFKKKQLCLRMQNEELYENLKFTPQEARLLELVSVGRHSLLLMGPRGLGKTTLAEALNYLSPKPEVSQYIHYKKYFHHHGDEFWRPFVRPHHSITHLALIGGGAACSPGEITRAHGGILLLDEMLEFNSQCQEALREPIQNKEVHLVRGARYQVYPSDFQLIATTNLCPCGQWLPGAKVDCHYSFSKCQKYRQKLSGPMLDRFDVLYFLKSNLKINKTIGLVDIRKRVEGIRASNAQLKSKLAEMSLDEQSISPFMRQKLKDELSSIRRLNASINIAKTLAIMNGKALVGDEELMEALDFTWQPFLELKI